MAGFGLGLALFSPNRRKIFSTSTMASSTSSPIATAIPPNVITLIDNSVPVITPIKPEHQRGHDERERDGRQCDEGRAEIEQEQKQHDHHQHRADHQGFFDVVDAPVDKALELEQVGIDYHSRQGARPRPLAVRAFTSSVSFRVSACGCFTIVITTPG